MEQLTGQIRLASTDPGINEIIDVAPPNPVAFTRHFDQTEDFFISIPEPFSVPPLPIHHDVRREQPQSSYLEALRDLLRKLVSRRVPIFNGLAYAFDPAEVQQPLFYRVYEHEGAPYLYLLRLDLTYRPTIHEALEQASNDMSPRYRTDRLYLEADIIPLERVESEGDERGPSSFFVEQLVSQTWIGETGRGYFVQGIWIDRDLTKFFSKLFLPPKKRTYPYYPFTCKYRSVCYNVIDLLPNRREREMAMLASAREFLAPHMEEIQEALRAEKFSESLEVFGRLKEALDPSWYERWEHMSVRAYLNEAERKEYIIETG